MSGVMMALLGACGQAQGGTGGYQVVAAPSSVVTPASVGGPVTATITGGTAPYTYQWSFKSGGGGMKIDSPTSNATTFSCFGTTERDAVAVCSILDTNGKAAVSNDVTVILISDNGGN